MATNVLVTVHDGHIERALKILKRAMSRSGTLTAMRRHEFYEKPSVRRRRKSKKARTQARKIQKRIDAAKVEHELRRYGSAA